MEKIDPIDKQKLVKTISANIRAEMERQGVTNSKLSEATEIHPMTMNDCVRGRKLPSVLLALAIARALGTTIEKLAEEPAKTKPRRAKQTA